MVAKSAAPQPALSATAPGQAGFNIPTEPIGSIPRPASLIDAITA